MRGTMAHDNTAGATDEVGATMEVGRWARSDHMFIIFKEFKGGNHIVCFSLHTNLVGGLEHFLFYQLLGMIIPTD